MKETFLLFLKDRSPPYSQDLVITALVGVLPGHLNNFTSRIFCLKNFAQWYHLIYVWFISLKCTRASSPYRLMGRCSISSQDNHKPFRRPSMENMWPGSRAVLGGLFSISFQEGQQEAPSWHHCQMLWTLAGIWGLSLRFIVNNPYVYLLSVMYMFIPCVLVVTNFHHELELALK